MKGATPEPLPQGGQRGYRRAMRYWFVLALVMLASPAAADPLEGLKGEKRPLLLFSKSRSLSSLDRQVDLLRELRPELEDRDMVVLVTAGSDDTYSAIGYTSLPRGASRDLRRRFAPQGSGLTVVLVGKDGGEKARFQNVVDPQELFDIIDAMPMRQREMRGEG